MRREKSRFIEAAFFMLGLLNGVALEHAVFPRLHIPLVATGWACANHLAIYYRVMLLAKDAMDAPALDNA
ncbi:hypothetical protein [Curvibacter sp. CHRR-16]|uniref:hypothetical protein n=1 Tax=Curvibacter sp. CHRR-16 TaxID=2835872 RepID=UPI002023AD37|nr:hypothetical protein [Curvibacter sp. CHRR-16]